MNTTGLYVKVTVALFALLVLTVGAAYVHFGAFNTVVAMSIAVVKALLIILFFMHLRRNDPVLRLFAFAGFFWLALMIVMTLSDVLTR